MKPISEVWSFSNLTRLAFSEKKKVFDFLGSGLIYNSKKFWELSKDLGGDKWRHKVSRFYFFYWESQWWLEDLCLSFRCFNEQSSELWGIWRLILYFTREIKSCQCCQCFWKLVIDVKIIHEWSSESLELSYLRKS